MHFFEEKVAKVIGIVGWLLVSLGGLSTAWLVMRIVSEGMREPKRTVVLAAFVLCCIAAGMFFVVLTSILNLLIRIARNTDPAAQERRAEKKAS